MATRYQDQVSNWESNTSASDAVLDGTTFHVFESWTLAMLIAWHTNDPVDQKEIDRNEAIFNIQGNRNPFIDHPEWVDDVWADCTDDSCIYVTDTANDGPGSLRAAIECAAEGEVITFSPELSNSTITLTTSPISVDKNITIEADAMTPITVSSASSPTTTLASTFIIEAGTSVVFKDFEIHGGQGPEGSTIKNQGNLILENMVLSSGSNSNMNSLLHIETGATLVIRGIVTID